MKNSKDRWRGFAPTLCWRRPALNILQNHLEEALALNKKLPPFSLRKGEAVYLLSVEEFLLALATVQLPYTRAVKQHFDLIVRQWPVGTVCWEGFPPEKNPYLVGNSQFPGWKAPTTEQVIAKEVFRDNRDLLLQTVAQGRQAARLGLVESDCELKDDLLKEAWLFGFRKELEKQQLNKDEKQP